MDRNNSQKYQRDFIIGIKVDISDLMHTFSKVDMYLLYTKTSIEKEIRKTARLVQIPIYTSAVGRVT